MVDTYRGVVRVRAWPKKRGPSKSKVVREQNAWFKAANAIAKIAAPSQLTAAIEATRNTGLYPRDLIVRAMGVGLIDIVDDAGNVITYRQDRIDPVAFQGAILELDVDAAIPINSVTPLTWPLPIKDTASFWDISEPTRLTIPAGVEQVEISARTLQLATKAGQLIILLTKNDAEFARQEHNMTAWHGATLNTGALDVVEGDYFIFNLFMTYSGGVAQAAGLTAFTINVVGAP